MITATLDGDPLEIIRAQVSLDDSWSPYVQATLTVKGHLPIDPEDGAPRVVCTGTQAGHTRTFDLAIDRRRNNDDGTATLELCSDEIRLHRYKRVAYTAYTPSTNSLRTLVQETLTEVLPGATLEAGPDAAIAPADLVWSPGQSAKDFIWPSIEKAGLRLWCDESRDWHLDESPMILPGSIEVDYDGDTLVNYADDIDLNDRYDAVVITYKWTDVLGDQYTAYDIASRPGFTNPYAITREDTPFPGTGAAAAMLNRWRSRGRTLPITVLSDYHATPGMSVIVTTPAAGDQAGWLTAVSFSSDDSGSEMSIRTRDVRGIPTMAWLFDEPGDSWLEIPVGTNWAEDV